MNTLTWLNSLKPALPLSPNKNIDGSFKEMSNSDIRRACEQRSVLVNGEPIGVHEIIDFPVFSLVFFPKSPTKRTTII